MNEKDERKLTGNSDSTFLTFSKLFVLFTNKTAKSVTNLMKNLPFSDQQESVKRIFRRH